MKRQRYAVLPIQMPKCFALKICCWVLIQNFVRFIKTWEEVVDAASDEHCPTMCRMDAMVEPQSCAQCLIYLMAGNASDHTRAAEVLAVPKSLEVEQAAY